MVGPRYSFDPSAATGSTESLVCVVENQREIREQLCQIFRAAMLSVRAFSSGHEFLGHRHHGPCCLVTDIDLPGISGFDLQSALAGHPEQIVFLSGSADVGKCARAMKAGAIDFLLKPADHETILEATGRALARSQSILTARDTRDAARKRFDTLTSRELEVMDRVIAGMLNKQAAVDLGIAEKTIKIHRGRVMHKLGVESVADLVRLAMIAEIEQ